MQAMQADSGYVLETIQMGGVRAAGSDDHGTAGIAGTGSAGVTGSNLEAMMGNTSRGWVLNKRVDREIEADTFIMKEEALPNLADGEFRVRTIYLSLDATNRVWIGDWDQYMDPVQVGEGMRGFVCGEVMESKNPDFATGTLVAGMATWSETITTNGDGFSAFAALPGISVAETFGALAVAGPTAHVGLLDIARIQAGDTVVVSAAAGAVGMMVGQIAKLKGCRTIGIAGGAEKCAFIQNECGYDVAIDYRNEDVLEALQRAAPDGVDVLFENVGGEILDAGLTVMKNFGRVVICGLISTYNQSGEPIPGPYMFRNLIMRRLRVQGFVILDYLEQYPAIQEEIAGWMLEGKVRFKVHIEDGLENAPDALEMLYSSKNFGKLLVRVGAEPAS